MADFNFAHFAVDYENRKRFFHVATIFKNQTVPGNAEQRLFPSQERTPLNELKKIVAPVQEVQEEFDFELGEVLTYEDAVRLCEEAEVNVSDMIVGSAGALSLTGTSDKDPEGRLRSQTVRTPTTMWN